MSGRRCANASVRAVLGLLLILSPTRGATQALRPASEARDCPAADSALGPRSAAQRRANVMQWQSADQEDSYLRTGTRQRSVSGIAVMVHWLGATPPTRWPGHLEVSVPTALTGEVRGAEGREFELVIDDSVRFSLGAPLWPRIDIDGDFTPSALPLSAALPWTAMERLARASSAAVRYRGIPFAFSPSDLNDVNALVRRLVCGSRAPVEHPSAGGE